MRSTRVSTLRTAVMIAALLAAAPATSFAASGGNNYPKAEEQRDVAARHQAETLQPRPPEEAIPQTSSAVDCADPANARMTGIGPVVPVADARTAIAE